MTPVVTAAMTDRFKPSRGGVINIWDYVDEEWAFADGRLALRGHNGSGKTKALEVLFPFVLDGMADSRRLDPFSGENRTMKSNLLFRGQESEYGYVWMEFARARDAHGASGTAEASAETVTLIIGMRAHRNIDGVRMSFFVTGKRVGVDFGLLSADSRPLTERQLRAVLEPDAWRKTATEYRDLVDHRLFGLGRERYAQLLDLLLALRRPLLAKDLDPAKVSDTLTSGLSPVDDDLVQQAARDFENLAAVQKLFDDLTAANAAVGEFRTHYEAYLRSHVKFALDRVQARSDVAADHAERLAGAAAARRIAVAAERAAEADREASRSEGETLQGRLAGLKNSEEYKAQGRIEDKRREVAARAAEVARQRDGLDRDRRRLADQTAAVGKLANRVTGTRAEADRIAAALADAAQRAGIADDGFGPVDAGDELIATARARVAARRDDIGEIRRLLEAIRDAKAKRAYAEQELGRKTAAHERQQHDADTAAARLTAARAEATETLTAWSARWSPPSDASRPTDAPPRTDEASLPVDGSELPDHLITTADIDALTEMLERTGEPGAASLAEAYDRCTADRQAATITAQANLGAALREARQHLTDLRAERDAIAAEQDDAPPASDLRPATRDARPGAPLWQLVRFAPDVPDETAAAIEGALYGAGLLTAWVHPDPALTRPRSMPPKPTATSSLPPQEALPVPAPGQPQAARRPSPTSSSPRIKSTSPPTSSSPCSAPSPSLTTSWHPGPTFRPARSPAASTTSSATPPRRRPRVPSRPPASPWSPRRPSSATASTSAPGPSRSPSTLARPTGPTAAAPGWPSRTSALRAPPDRSASTPPGPNEPPRCTRTSAAPAASSRTPARSRRRPRRPAAKRRCWPGPGKTSS